MENTEKVEHDEILIAFGGEIKAVTPSRLEGWAVKFSSAEDPDLEGDFFAADTDFGPAEKLPLYYDHGMNPAFGKKSIGTAHIKRMDEGLWFEAELEKAEGFDSMIVELAERMKLRASSGAVGHLVERIQDGESFKITNWPLGELSLTTTPAAGMATTVMPMKAFQTAYENTPETDEAEASKAIDAPAVEVVSDATKQAEAIAEAETMQTEIQEDIMAEEAKNTEQTDALKGVKEMLNKLNARLDAQEAKAAEEQEVKAVTEVPAAPAIIKETGDSEGKAYAAWIKSGDAGALRGAKGYSVDGREVEIKASNAVDMQFGTDAEGGHAVPQGHFDGIMARRDQSSLKTALGLTRVPGVGTVTHVPVDGEADGEFVATAEEGSYDKDTPTIGNVAFTLAKYTKNVPISEELLADETSGLLSFIENWVGRGMAKTDNTLIAAEVEANGTEFKTLTAAGIAAGEVEDMAFNDNLGPYLDGGNVAWVTRASTYGNIASLTGNDRLYAEQTIASTFGVNRPSLLGYPVFFSDKVDADGTGDNKPIYVRDWSQMGYYEGDGGLTVLRDPYSEAATGQVNLWYRFRIDYAIMQAEAIGYGRNSTT